MDGIDLFAEIVDAFNRGDELVDEMRVEGRESAEADKLYRIAKRKRILYERANGQPATLIPDLVKGAEDIATLKVAAEAKKTDYEATVEAINHNKRKIDFFREQIERESCGR